MDREAPEILAEFLQRVDIGVRLNKETRKWVLAINFFDRETKRAWLELFDPSSKEDIEVIREMNHPFQLLSLK
jgi:hypothetical protein